MNSATSSRTKADVTDLSAPPDQAVFSLWHVYALLGMFAAAAAVWVSKSTHPVALVLLSTAALAAAMVALALHRAVAAFFERDDAYAPLDVRRRELLEKEKALALRSIKELEFDHAMGKIGDADFAAIGSRLRARALSLMQDLERAPRPRPAGAAARRHACPECDTPNELDAKFCKSCGHGLVKEFEIVN